MKVKDLVSLKGCYSAHDVGELEIDLKAFDEHLKSLLDTALPIVEIFNAESPTQKGWKIKWINDVKSLTTPRKAGGNNE